MFFCSNECWNCNDKYCEHYIDKSSLYFENLRLKESLLKYEDKIKILQEEIKHLDSINCLLRKKLNNS